MVFRAKKTVVEVAVSPAKFENIRSVTKQKAAKISLVTEQKISRTSLGDFVAHLNALSSCYEEECDFPDHEPRSYSYALGQAIVKSLDELSVWVKSKPFFDDAVSQIGRTYILSEDRFVQAAALRLLSTQPTSLENLLAILEGVFNQGYDANLVAPTLKELERYKDPQDLVRINEVLAQALLTGAPFLAEEVSLRMAPFVDGASFGFYKELLGQLPGDSVYYHNLESILNLASR